MTDRVKSKGTFRMGRSLETMSHEGCKKGLELCYLVTQTQGSLSLPSCL